MSKTSLVLVRQRLRSTRSYAGALLASLPAVPLVATMISITMYVTVWRGLILPNWFLWFDPFVPLLVGAIPTLLLWLLLAYLCRDFTAVDLANQNGCSMLLQHVSRLNCYIDAWCPNAEKEIIRDMFGEASAPQQRSNVFSRWWMRLRRKTPVNGADSGNGGKNPRQDNQTPGMPVADHTVEHLDHSTDDQDDKLSPRKLIIRYRNEIYHSLLQRSSSWISGGGYIHLWDLMNRAEEALINVEPREDVVCEAVDDEMRLNNSVIQNSEEWTNKLRLAVQNLDALVPCSSATDYLKPATPRLSVSPVQPSVTTTNSGSALTPEKVEAQRKSQQALARAVLRKVREALDTFDADNWSKLIEARNQLICTTILVGLAVFAFVEFAMLIKVSPTHLVIAVIFYAFGALIGLINRLSLESTNNNAIDDYNLSFARLIVTPQLSGIAAVIGVLLFQKASTLGGVYTFEGITTTLVIATTFGLAPNLLINQLKKQADGYTGNLKSTQSTTGK